MLRRKNDELWVRRSRRSGVDYVTNAPMVFSRVFGVDVRSGGEMAMEVLRRCEEVEALEYWEPPRKRS